LYPDYLLSNASANFGQDCLLNRYPIIFMSNAYRGRGSNKALKDPWKDF
jgi:hypothetical protein